MANEKTKIEGIYVITYGVNFKARTISFGSIDESDNSSGGDYSNSDFTFTNVEVVVRSIHEMVLQSPSKPITIRMNSSGGNLMDALYLKDVILSSPCQFKFVGGGIIASAATIIMACCDERYLHQDTIVMVHEHSGGVSDGKQSNSKIETRVGDKMVDMMADIYSANSYMSRPYWMKVLNSGRDIYYYAQEAVEIGLVDKVIQPLKRGNLRKMRADIKKNGINADKLQKTLDAVHKRSGFIPDEVVRVKIEFDAIDETLTIDTDITE